MKLKELRRRVRGASRTDQLSARIFFRLRELASRTWRLSAASPIEAPVTTPLPAPPSLPSPGHSPRLDRIRARLRHYTKGARNV